jgi:huntingtin-interacting protein 1-related protein
MSKTQERLEVATKTGTKACEALVKLVRTILAKQVEEEDVDSKNMAALEFKKREMEQQVEI